MKNRNCILREVHKTSFDFRGRVIFSVKRRIVLEEINIRVYLIMNRIIFCEGLSLKTEDSQANLEAMVYSMKNLSSGVMRIGNDANYSCLEKQ